MATGPSKSLRIVDKLSPQTAAAGRGVRDLPASMRERERERGKAGREREREREGGGERERE